MSNEVVYYSSDETGAPTLNNVNGSMINVLDACLVDGFNAKSVTSLVVSGGVATATISTHGYLSDRIVAFAGSSVTGGTPGLLNGNKKITVVDGNTVTFDATGVADQTASGTITCKRPSLGFTKEHTGTNKAIYKRSDVQATAMMLRVDDTGSGVATTTYARAIMVESASGIDSYTNATPTATQLSGGQYWTKGPDNSTAKPWLLVGDGRTFYFWTDHASYPFTSYTALHFRMFGDITPFRAGDAYHCMIGGDRDAFGNNNAPLAYSPETHPAVPSLAFARLWTGVDFSAYAALIHPTASGTMIGASGSAYPSPVDNGLVMQKTLVTDYHATFVNPFRGVARGLVNPVANIGNRLHKRVLSDLTDFDGDVLFVATITTGGPGCFGVDLTGPWG